jgi:hypothetical protein
MSDEQRTDGSAPSTMSGSRHVPPAIQLTPVFAPTPRNSPHYTNFSLLSPPADEVQITFGPSDQPPSPTKPPRPSSAPPTTVAADFTSGLLSPPIRPSTSLQRRRTTDLPTAPRFVAPGGELLPPPPPLCMFNQVPHESTSTYQYLLQSVQPPSGVTHVDRPWPAFTTPHLPI